MARVEIMGYINEKGEEIPPDYFMTGEVGSVVFSNEGDWMLHEDGYLRKMDNLYIDCGLIPPNLLKKGRIGSTNMYPRMRDDYPTTVRMLLSLPEEEVSWLLSHFASR